MAGARHNRSSLSSIPSPVVKHAPPLRLILPLAGSTLYAMRNTILSAMLVSALAAPAWADSYPVSGRWGESQAPDKGAIDCSKLRVIAFNGEERTDSGGGVPAYRNVSVSPDGAAAFRVVDAFTTGQINNARVNYTLRRIDADRIELQQQFGGTLKLQRCK